MTESTLDRMRAELDDWRARLDELRVQANLGRMEARDRLKRLEERLEPARRDAQRTLERVVETGAGEARAVAKSLQAGWKELLRTHEQLTREARRSDD